MRSAQLLLLFLLFNTIISAQTCDFVIPINKNFFDGRKEGIKPGNTICIAEGERKYLQIKNVVGDSLDPILIINKGIVRISNEDFAYGFKMQDSKYFKVSGKSKSSDTFGIKILSTGPGSSGLTIDGNSSDFEIEGLEITKTGFAGIMSKSDPKCDGEFTRDQFEQSNISIHDNYIHNVGGEALYIGNSFYTGYTKNKKCPGDTLYPHEIRNLQIFNNIIDSTGWEGIQIGCASENVKVYSNIISNFGLKNEKKQYNGIQIGEGSGGYYYNNIIKDGFGNGFIILGKTTTILYNNYIVNSGRSGIFCDDRESETGKIIALLNNTIINSAENTLRWYNEKSNTIFKNNIFIHTNSNKPIYTNPDSLSFDNTNNWIVSDVKEIRMVSTENGLYIPDSDSPVLNAALDISEYIQELNIQQNKNCGANPVKLSH